MGVKKLIKSYFHIIVAQVLTSLVAVIIVKVSLKHVSVADYGNIILILTASNTIQVFLNWTCTALVRFGVEEFIADKNIINTFWSRTSIYLINLTLILALSPLWFSVLSKFLDLHTFIKPLILIHIVLSSLWMHGQQALQAARKPQVQSYLLLAERILTLLVLGIIVNFSTLRWESIFRVLLVSSLVMFIVSLVILRPVIHFSGWRRLRTTGTKILVFSLPLFPFAITSFFCTNYLNAYFINAYLTKSDLTVFNTIFQITGLLTQLPILFNMLLMPQFISMRLENKQDVIKRYMEEIMPFLTLIWGLGIGIVAALLAWFIPSFFGTGFYGVTPVIILLSAGALFSFPSLVGHSPFILSLSDVKVSFPMALVIAIVNVVAQFLLIKPFGLTGSAIATILSTLSGLIYLVAYVSRKYSFNPRLLMLSLLPATLSIILYLFIENTILFIFSLTTLSLLCLLTIRRQIIPYVQIAMQVLKLR